MITLDFLATVMLVSVSGVLGPGPLFVASTLRATRVGALSGLECAIGHTIVEAPLVFGLALGLSEVLNPTSVRVIAIIGGSVLLVFATAQFIQASNKIGLDKKPPAFWQKQPGVILGAVFTLLNPFFILWWLTVGSVIISQALLLGAFEGVALMFGAHIWMDYAWLGGTAMIAARGRLFLGKWYRWILIAFGIAMAYFGVTFVLSAVG